MHMCSRLLGVACEFRGELRPPSICPPQGHHRAEAEDEAPGFGPDQRTEGDEDQA